VRVFQFVDAVAKKGDCARLHAGTIFEDVVAAFDAEGLDPMRYGIVCCDPAIKTVTKAAENGAESEIHAPDLDENGQPKWLLGLRYDELAQFVIAGLSARLAALEGSVR
jgi:hypothetical protein